MSRKKKQSGSNAIFWFVGGVATGLLVPKLIDALKGGHGESSCNIQ